LGEHSFWPVWLTLTAVALVSTALLVRRKAGPAASREAPLPASFGRSHGTAASVTLLALFLAGYIAGTVVGDDFTFYDNSPFTLYSLRGVDNWWLTSLQQRLVKTGGRLMKHARYYWLLLAESHLTWRLVGSMVGRIAALPMPAG
jgi:hypothetical protein